jgi:hypothetical protein
MDAYEVWENEVRNHRAGTFPTNVLHMIERTLPRGLRASAETGCGKSTILLSNLSQHHTVFCLDDRQYGQESSVDFFHRCPLTREDRIELVFGPTQLTLPRYSHTRRYDLVLLDGPHGWPFPELEYYSFYPHIEPGGLLLVDDCQIPTIARMADILAEDPMWHLEGFLANTGLFRRTDAPLFDPCGDGWWEQSYNRRRVPPENKFYLGDRPPRDIVSTPQLDNALSGNAVENTGGTRPEASTSLSRPEQA